MRSEATSSNVTVSLLVSAWRWLSRDSKSWAILGSRNRPQTVADLYMPFVIIGVYCRAYIHLRFKHIVLGTHLCYPGCLSRTVR